MIKLAIFDMDGTIFESHLDWPTIKKKLNIKGDHILKEMYLDDKIDVERLKILEKYERENTLKTKPVPGISEFLAFLRLKNIITALVTNNNRANTDYLLNKYQFVFDMVITREKKLWKPDPDAHLHVMQKYQSRPQETISIGDSFYDAISSKKANIAKVFIIKKKPEQIFSKISNVENVTYFEDYYQLKRLLVGKHHL